MHTNIFPTTLAMGPAFCNRQMELKRLLANFNRMNPTLLMSPRRYGKTSLAMHSFLQLQWPYVHIDFYTDLTEAGIERALLNGIGILLGKLETVPQRLWHIATEFFAKMQVSISFEKTNLKLDFSKKQNISSEQMLDALEKLNLLAQKKKKQVILYLDEFQVLCEVMQNYSMEGAIRHAMQKSTHVAYLFSGSNRHLIESMFHDKNRPFYQSCDVMVLNRILEKDYEPHIQKASKARWKKQLADDALQSIFSITERHPYYVNKLCSLLWLLDQSPTSDNVIDTWQEYALENKSAIEREIELLSFNQRKVLIAIASNKPTKEIFGQHFSILLNIAPGSISRTVQALQKHDYVMIDTEGYYRVLDPLISYILSGRCHK